MSGQGFVATIFGLAVGMSFLAHAATFAPPPSFAAIVYGIIPFLVLGTIVTALIFLTVTRDHLDSVLLYVIRIACVTCGIALGASLLHLWNDGRYDAVLSPHEAFVSILTLGLFPLKAGPDVLIRFFPAIFAVGAFLRLRRLGGAFTQNVGAAFFVYLVLAGFNHALSWIAGVLAIVGRETLQSSTDAVRLLIRAQADGYWTRAQADRFFTPMGLQSDNSFLLIHAAVMFLGISIACILLGRREVRGFNRLVKQLCSRRVLFVGSVMLLGLAIGNVNRIFWSYTDVLACLVFIVSAFAWLLSWHLRRDFASVEISVGTIHELPLPVIASCALCIALYGAFVLGWPVFFGFLIATIADIGCLTPQLGSLSSRWFGASGPRATALRNAGAFAVIAASLGSAALALAMRDALAPIWMLRLVFTMAILAGLGSLIHRLELFSRSHGIQAMMILLSLAALFFLANQRALWILFLPFVACILITVRDAASWPRRRAYPISFTFVAIGFFVLFAPKLLNLDG